MKELTKHAVDRDGRAEQEEAPFKYALLQFVKKDDGDNEINVIPVGKLGYHLWLCVFLCVFG